MRPPVSTKSTHTVAQPILLKCHPNHKESPTRETRDRMPTNKAANNTTHKAEKASANNQPSDDLCQAYEHLGRFEILEGGLSGVAFVEVNLLANLAQQQIDSGYGRNATNLLHAAEHLSFASLAPKHSADFASRVPPELKAAVASELDRLTRG